MQFITIVSLFALGALAAPAPAPAPVAVAVAVPVAEPADVVARTPFSIHSFLSGLSSSSCDHIKCAAALGPAVAGCAIAAAQEFLDPLSDAACIAAAVNDGVNLPSGCNNCGL